MQVSLYCQLSLCPKSCHLSQYFLIIYTYDSVSSDYQKLPYIPICPKSCHISQFSLLRSIHIWLSSIRITQWHPVRTSPRFGHYTSWGSVRAACAVGKGRWVPSLKPRTLEKCSCPISVRWWPRPCLPSTIRSLATAEADTRSVNHLFLPCFRPFEGLMWETNPGLRYG